MVNNLSYIISNLKLIRNVKNISERRCLNKLSKSSSEIKALKAVVTMVEKNSLQVKKVKNPMLATAVD